MSVHESRFGEGKGGEGGHVGPINCSILDNIRPIINTTVRPIVRVGFISN